MSAIVMGGWDEVTVGWMVVWSLAWLLAVSMMISDRPAPRASLRILQVVLMLGVLVGGWWLWAVWQHG